MPPQDGGTGWMGWLGSITGLGKSGQEEKEGHDATRDPVCNDPDFDNPEELATNKRRLASEDTAPRKKAKCGPSDLPDYGSPSSGTSIGYPAGFISRVQRSTAASNMSRSKVAGGGFRPQNTLNNTMHAPKNSRPNAYAGSNGDAFTGRERGMPPTKKPRIEWTSPHEYANDPITDEADSSRPRVTGVNGKKVNHTRENARPQQMVQYESRKAPFEGQEHKSLDHLTQISATKTRRKPVDGSRSSQPSSRTSPVDLTDDGVGQTQGNAVVVLDDTSQELSQSHVQGTASPQGSALPDVNDLANGVDGSSMRARRESDNSIRFVQAQAKPSVSPSSRAGDRTQLPKQKQQPTPNHKRKTIDPDEGGSRPDTPRPGIPYRGSQLAETLMQGQQRRRSETADTRTKFQRDDTSAAPLAQSGVRRRDAMKADSGRAGGRDSALRESLGSADELAGPTTVGRASPEKAQIQVPKVTKPDGRSRESRSPSASNLPRTAFTQGGRTQASARKAARNQRQPPDEEDERIEIPLANFYATSCFLPDGNVTMRYDHSQNELDIYLGKSLQVIHGQQTTVHISNKEVNEVVWAKESRHVVVKGPSDRNGVSNGYICFTLREDGDKAWFANHIWGVANERLKFKTETAERMKSTFDQTSVMLSKQHDKRQGAVAEENASLRRANSQQYSRAYGDEEEIKYEDEKPVRSYRRRGMLGEDIHDDIAKAKRSSGAYEESPFFQNRSMRRPTRQTKPVKERTPSPPPPEKWTQVNKPARWAHSVVYPNQGARRVTVDFQDLERLDEGEFLNDNVISFALRRIEEQMAPKHKERVHFFNSFFYTALTTKNGRKAFNYDAVKRWTKSKDLLGCDYVVVPINIDLHWFVAIICNLPNLSRRPAALEYDETNEEIGETADADVHADLPPDMARSPFAPAAEEQSPEEAAAMRNLSLSDGDGTSQNMGGGQEQTTGQRAPEHRDSQSVAKQSAAPATGHKKAKRRPPSYNPDKPAIITLDSFGAPHTGEIRNLKEYLKAEAEAKRGTAVDIGEIQGMNAKNSGIPTQTNFCDCGIYLVAYVEQFAKHPRDFAEKAMQRTLGQEGEFAEFDPSQKRDKIRSELLDLQKDQEAEHKAKKADKKALAPKAEAAVTQMAAATRKPESKPASKAASPVQTAGISQVAASEQNPPWEVVSPKPRNEAQSTMQAQASQDKDLEFEAPRALGTSTRTAGNAQQYSSQSHLSSEEEEMLDDPVREHGAEQSQVKGPPLPSTLLDGFQADLEQSVQTQLNHQRDRQRVEAEKGDTTRESSYNGTEELTAEAGDSDLAEEDDVIDLGDEEDASAEIPDSQEQSQRWTGGVEWAGKRTTFA